MNVRDRGPEPADVQTLRAELDELLRARQFAAQRERRLSEELRSGHSSDRAPGPGRPSRQPDPELLRQLAQAQNLREGLGARCLELSDRLLAAEDRLLTGRSAVEPPLRPGHPTDSPPQGHTNAPAGWGASPIPPQRPHSPAARFDTDRQGTPAGRSAPAGRPGPGPADPNADTSPNRRHLGTGRPTAAAEQASWARTGIPGQAVGATRPADAGFSHAERPRTERPGLRRDNTGATGPWNARSATTESGAAAGAGAGAGINTTSADRPSAQAAQAVGHTNDRFQQTAPGPGPAASNLAGSPGGEDAAQAPGSMRPRTTVELVALVQRISGLHQQGATHESAAIVRQVAVMITPDDVARLAALLQQNGPSGSSTYLARSVSAGAPEHAAETLAVLRREGMIDEAADLFHTLWSASSAALPALLAALEQSGQSADGQTLLWERASAPAEELAELAQHLKAAGRTGDARHLLRQAAGRPINEVATIAGTLNEDAAAELIGELVRLRSASDIGRFGAAIQGATELYDTLLFAADDLEESRARSVFTALRTGGLPTQPAPRPRSRSRQRR